MLKSADAVVYDRLVSPEVLALAPESARRINVGKAPKCHPVPQAEINRILDFVHQEAVSRLTEENRTLRDERAELQREKERLELEIHRLVGELRKTADELNGIKSTRAYKLYKATLAQIIHKLV